MKNHSLEKKAYDVLDYSERYINNGSPSGFGVSKQLFGGTDPYSNKPHYPLLMTRINHFLRHMDLGTLNPITDSEEFFVHPMMREIYENLGCKLNKSISVKPTSSGRTVVTCDKPRTYIKLHFDATLGRINRAQTYTKAAAGIEVGNILENGLVNGLLPERFGLLREIGARIVWHTEQVTSSYIERAPEFAFRGDLPIYYAIPYFSLLSSDKKEPLVTGSVEPNLVNAQIRKSLFANPQRWRQNVLGPIISAYFQAVKNLGLQIEFNAQNLLVVVAKDFSPLGIVLRDFSGVEKDEGFKSDLWPIKFVSHGYKFINPGDDDYQIRHSFSFDSKLSDYVIKPVLDMLASSRSREADEIRGELRSQVEEECRELPEGFFPKDIWYSHPKVVLTGERPYIEHPCPLLR